MAYSQVINNSLNLIVHLLCEIDKGLNEDLLTDELKDLLIVNKIKLGRMERHHQTYLNNKKELPK